MLNNSSRHAPLTKIEATNARMVSNASSTNKSNIPPTIKSTAPPSNMAFPPTPKLSSSAEKKIRTPDLPSAETLEAFRGVKENMTELMSYYKASATKPASSELISALKVLKAYSQKISHWDFLYQVGNYSGLEFETVTAEDNLKGIMYMNHPDVSTAMERNSFKINFLSAVKYVDHVERILYKEKFSVYFT